MPTNPFEGKWRVTFFELRNEIGMNQGRPFGSTVDFEIVADVGSALKLVVGPAEAAGSAEERPVFEGSWHDGEDASMSVRWLDENAKEFYQMVAVRAADKLLGGYFRTRSGRADSLRGTDSEGAGTWVGTGPILP